MDKTKADILREQSAAEVMRWIQRNPDGVHIPVHGLCVRRALADNLGKIKGARCISRYRVIALYPCFLFYFGLNPMNQVY